MECILAFMDAAQRGELDDEMTASAARFRAAMDDLKATLDGMG